MTTTRRVRVLTIAAACTLAASAILTACSSSSSTPGRPGGGRTIDAPTSPSASSSSAAAALIDATSVDSGTTTIAFTEGFVRALYTHGLNTETTGKARIDDSHRAYLKVTSGSATVYGTAAQRSRTAITLRHGDAGFAVTDRRSTARVSNLVLTIGPRSVVTASIGTSTSPATVAFLDLTVDSTARRSGSHVVLGGIAARLDPAAARALDAAFGTTVFGTYSGKQVATVTVSLDS